MSGVKFVTFVTNPTAFKSNPTAFNDKSPTLRGLKFTKRPNKIEDITYSIKTKILKNYKIHLSTQQIYKNILNYLIV